MKHSNNTEHSSHTPPLGAASYLGRCKYIHTVHSELLPNKSLRGSRTMLGSSLLLDGMLDALA